MAPVQELVATDARARTNFLTVGFWSSLSSSRAVLLFTVLENVLVMQDVLLISAHPESLDTLTLFCWIRKLTVAAPASVPMAHSAERR